LYLSINKITIIKPFARTKFDLNPQLIAYISIKVTKKYSKIFVLMLVLLYIIRGQVQMNFKRVISSIVAAGIILQGTAFATINIRVNLPTLTLTVKDGDKLIKQYPIAAGQPSTPTITGNYKLIEKQVNPTWTDPATGKVTPGGPGNPLGLRWMRVIGNYGIHGNAYSPSIGTYASHGCMRMYNNDVPEVYDMVKVGTPVSITYDTVDTYKSALVVHPDIYRKGVNNYNSALAQAKKLNIKLTAVKQNNIKKYFNKKDIVFSNTWCLYINKDFITNDTLNIQKTKIVKVKQNIKVKQKKYITVQVKKEDTTVSQDAYNNTPSYITVNETRLTYVTVNKTILVDKKVSYKVNAMNLNDISKYLGLTYKLTVANKASIRGNLVDISKINNKIYITTEDLSKSLGVSLKNDNALEIIHLDMAYSKYNGQFVSVSTRIIDFFPYVNANAVAVGLNLKDKFKSTKTGVYLNGTKLSGVWKNGVFFAKAESFAKAIKRKADYWSIKKYVNFI
jgi:hypothetical protein